MGTSRTVGQPPASFSALPASQHHITSSPGQRPARSHSQLSRTETQPSGSLACSGPGVGWPLSDLARTERWPIVDRIRAERRQNVAERSQGSARTQGEHRPNATRVLRELGQNAAVCGQSAGRSVGAHWESSPQGRGPGRSAVSPAPEEQEDAVGGAGTRGGWGRRKVADD